MSFDFINDKNKKVHFIGIGGVSMSGLAEILLKNGFSVSGSDMKASYSTERLEKQGAKIYIGHSASNITDCDLVVYTAAIAKDNEELLQADLRKIPKMDRAEFLGEIMKGHKYNVAIAGTHGKTTTTSMISHIILEEGLDPTILVGGQLDIIKGNVRASNSDYFITEACEYKGSFLKFYPYIGVILNIEADHLDYYKDIDEIEAAFLKFAQLIPKDGYLVGNSEDSRVQNIINKIDCNIITFGIDTGDVHIENLISQSNGESTFDLIFKGVSLGSVTLHVPGRYNVMNALAGIASALCLNVSFNSIATGLFDFHGTHRRFEIKGAKDGVTVIDDYAHHPTAIKAALSAAKNYPHNNLICVFQPHTYTRTYALFNEFSKAFYDADQVILTDIYAAREKDTGLVSSLKLSEAIKETGMNCTYLSDFDSIVKHLKNILKPDDLLITVGAGDVFEIGEIYLK